jgi:hypothetical protein
MNTELLRKLAIEAVCPLNHQPTTPTEMNMVRVLEEFGKKVCDAASAQPQPSSEEVRLLLDEGCAAAEHVAIAGSYDNLKEGQRYIIKWLAKVYEWRRLLK